MKDGIVYRCKVRALITCVLRSGSTKVSFAITTMVFLGASCLCMDSDSVDVLFTLCIPMMVNFYFDLTKFANTLVDGSFDVLGDG